MTLDWLDTRCYRCRLPKSPDQQAWCPECHQIVVRILWEHLNQPPLSLGTPDIARLKTVNKRSALTPPAFTGRKANRARLVSATVDSFVVQDGIIKKG